MTTTNLQTAPYLREQRQFPKENVDELSRQIDHAYVDIAAKVNVRTIGIFAINFSVIAGDKWYLSSQPQQVLRRVYSFTSVGTPLALGFVVLSIDQFTPRCYGSYTDGTNWYGLIYGSNGAIASQNSFYINGTNNTIVFLAGSGAPSVTRGTIVLEWLAFV